jgi:hypothetical protein
MPRSSLFKGQVGQSPARCGFALGKLPVAFAPLAKVDTIACQGWLPGFRLVAHPAQKPDRIPNAVVGLGIAPHLFGELVQERLV